MRALITGGTGFIGRALIRRLESPTVLARSPERARERLGEVVVHAWNAGSGPPSREAFEEIEAVFHLAGESVGARRWNPEVKRRIRDSRIEGTRNLVEAIARLDPRPRVLVSASAVGFYGSRGDETLTEESGPGEDFLAEVCRRWEEEARAVETLGVRSVQVRIGVVLGRDGLAMKKMLRPFRLGLGGPLAGGRSWMPWIHLDDIVSLLVFAAENEAIQGPLNGVAPEPVTNREFTRTLASVLKRPAFLPVPRFGLRLVMGEFAEVVVSSLRVMPERALAAGFPFAYPALRPALERAVEA